MGQNVFDIVIIGSGFGGSLVAHPLVNAGLDVLMLEQGPWVLRGPHNWAINGSCELTPYFIKDTSCRVVAEGAKDSLGQYSCVGGQSVFYGGVSFRLREGDFDCDPEIVGNSNAHWPIQYSDLEPYYCQAEQILNIAGESGSDITEPYRSKPYPQDLSELSETSRIISAAAQGLGLRPFRLPLAINYSPSNGQEACKGCTTCDTFACASQSKNDVATCVLPSLIKKGLALKVDTVAIQLQHKNNRLIGVKCYDKKAKRTVLYHGKNIILSAGTLASPHLLLSSNLHRLNPGGFNSGHYLMRHCNAIVFGFFPKRPNKLNQFHKQIGFNDFYFGHPTVKTPKRKLGNIQQIHPPPVGLIYAMFPQPLAKTLCICVENLTGLLIMTEDQPQFQNCVKVDWSKKNKYGLPQLLVTHYYTKRDYKARNALIKKAKKILHNAGALFCYVHKIKTFSHAMGTLRMGGNPQSSVLDKNCKFRGIKNLYVVDGSFMPTAGGLNPSLTIAANALRVGDYIAQNIQLGA